MGGFRRSIDLGIFLLTTTALGATSALAQSAVTLDPIIVTPTGRPEPRSQIPSTVQVIRAEPGPVVAPVAPAGAGPGAAGPDAARLAPQSPISTPTGRPEPRSNFYGTTQVIPRSEIERSTARSVTELLVENAVGFLGQWSPDQTQIVIRGATTEPQGRDFRSQVLILINGHRAGTANLSKLSLGDIDRIEIVRGPASVIYGSQNLGGVVNIIMKTGLTAPGTFVEGRGGSFGLADGKAQNGGVRNGFDWYVGGSTSRSGDYHHGGGGVETNTAWERRGATVSTGYQIDPFNHVGINVRTDGIYDAGFRGSASSIYGIDTRYNRSYDINYEGGLPGGRVTWFFQNYAVNDVDNLNNPSPLATISNINPLTGALTLKSQTSLDRNRRQLDVVGTRFQPRVKLWDSNDLLLGWDRERSWIRSTHDQANLAGIVTGVAPSDNNQTENVNAYYFEDSQRFFNDRLTVRGGMRWTYGSTNLDPTPNVVGLIPGTSKYDAVTHSVGATWRAWDWVTFRTGASTGFRAPTATELGSNFTQATSQSKVFGNPSLKPESSDQIEAGATFTWSNLQLDTAVFQNVIHDRIRTVVRAAPNPLNVSDTVNNAGDIVVHGVEVQAQTDMLKNLRIQSRNWLWSVFANGFYNFKMVDEGATPDALGRFNDKPTRVSKYDLSIGTRFGETGHNVAWRDWTLRITGVLRGPQWYNTEEVLSPLYYPAQDRTRTLYEKDAFWVLNTRYDVGVGNGWTAYLAVNNILDVNQHPTFIAIDEVPCKLDVRAQNGACGNSMPGREFIVGLQGRW